MAAINNHNTVQSTRQTSNSGTYVTAVSDPAANYETNSTYFVLVTASVGGADTAAIFHYRMVQGGTPIADSEMILEPRTSTFRNYIKYAWFGIITQGGTADDIDFEFHSNGTAQVNADSISIVAIRLDADLVEDTDWRQADFATDQEHTATPVTRVTETFTPATAGDDWLILGFAQIAIDNITKQHEINLQEDASNVGPPISVEGADLDEQRIYVLPYVAEGLSASSHTYRIQTNDEDTTGLENDHLHSKLFILNLSAFESHSVDQVADPSEGAVDVWVTMATLASGSYSPTTTGDHAIIGDVLVDHNSTNAEHRHRISVDGTFHPTGIDADDDPARTEDDTDQRNVPTSVITSLLSSGVDVDFDARSSETNVDWLDGFLVAFSMELAGVPPAGVGKIIIQNAA